MPMSSVVHGLKEGQIVVCIQADMGRPGSSVLLCYESFHGYCNDEVSGMPICLPWGQNA